MKLPYHQFLRTPDPAGARCVYVHGTDALMKDDVVARLRAAEEEAEVTALDGAALSLEQVLVPAQTAGLFSPRRLIIVRQAHAIDADMQEALAQRLGRIGEHARLILVTGQETAETPMGRRAKGGSSALLAAVAEAGLAVECRPLNASQAEKWLREEADRAGKKMAQSAAALLVSRQGTDLARLRSELDKAVLYSGDSGTITNAHIEQTSTRRLEETIYRLGDAAGDRSFARAIELERALLADNVRAAHLVSVLTSHFRQLWAAKILSGERWQPGKGGALSELAKSSLPIADDPVKMFRRLPWKYSMLSRQAAKFTWPELCRAMHLLLGCDLAIKEIDGPPRDEALALELLLAGLCRARR